MTRKRDRQPTIEELEETIRTSNPLLRLEDSQWRSLSQRGSLTWNQFCKECNFEGHFVKGYSKETIQKLFEDISSTFQNEYLKKVWTYKLKSKPFEVEVSSTKQAVYIKVREIEPKNPDKQNRTNIPLTQRVMF